MIMFVGAADVMSAWGWSPYATGGRRPSGVAAPSGIGGGSVIIIGGPPLTIGLGGVVTPSAFSLFKFMSPHTMSINTNAWKMSPNIVEHPSLDATQLPRTFLVILKVSGFATIKNMRAETTDMINFFFCSSPLQPHPQSLKAPIYHMTRKKLLKVQGPYITKEAEMAFQVQKASTFDASSVIFSKLRKNKNGGKAVYLNGTGNKKLYLQFPYMRAPFGLSTFVDEATKKTSYSLDLSFDKNDESILKLQDTFKKFDELVVKIVSDNSQEWLGKKYNEAVIKEALYKPLVRPGKGDYPATMKLKVLIDQKTNEFVPEAYNTNREKVDMASIEKGQKVMCIVDLNQIWFIDNKFGISARLQQVLLEPSKKLPSFAFQDVDPADETADADAEEEYEEVDE